MRVLELLFVLSWVVIGRGQDWNEKPINSILSCDLCKLGLELAQTLLEQNKSEEYVSENIITYVCPLVPEPLEVCEGAVLTFTPTVVPILLNIDDASLDLCKAMRFCPSSSSKSEPKDIYPTYSISSGAKVDDSGLRILHISDVHLDLQYFVGSEAACSLPLCCRKSSNSPIIRPAKKWGDYNCDLTYPMFSSLLSFIKTLQPPPDFIIWTGDNPPHDIWEESINGQLEVITNVTNTISQTIPHIAIYPSIGNHDTFPVDQFNLHPIDTAHHDDFQWLRDYLAKQWGRFLTSEADSSVRNFGYYDILVKPGLRLISINSQWGDAYNFYLYLQEDQQKAMFLWLSNLLTNAVNNGEKVIIIGHIATGDSVEGFVSNYAEEYLSLVRQFSHIIVGQFYGHTHSDEYQMIYNSNGVPVGMNFLAPSVTTFTDHNPTFRIYQYDANYTMIDYIQYYVNLTDANRIDSAEWKVLYTAKDEYGLPDMTPSSWNNLINRMSQSDSLFSKWYFNYRSATPVQPCTGTCKQNLLCSLRSSTSDQYFSCSTTSKKRYC